MIYIDFQAGSHGNFLEFVCNKYLANIAIGNSTPFNSNGAAHDKKYLERKQFNAGHWFEFPTAKQFIVDTRVITVKIQPDDLLPVTAVSLLRAGDYNIDNDLLEIDTYNKLKKISDYRSFLQDIKESYFRDTRVEGYQIVQDTSWPNITTAQEFDQLPEHIKTECENIHKLVLPMFDEQNSDCPRYVLREFFKIGFINPAQQGFMKRQHLMTYDASNQTTTFPFSCFYHADQFFNELEKLSKWLDMPLNVTPELISLHEQFVNKQPYRNIKTECDHILHRIYNNEVFELPKLVLLQESYLNACLEKHYGVEALFDQPQWFANSQQILEHFDIH